MKATCGEGRGTQKIVCSALTSANPRERSALRCRPIERPSPLIPPRWTWFPCLWEFSLICADDQQWKTKRDNRYQPSRPHHASFFTGVQTKQVYSMSLGRFCGFFLTTVSVQGEGLAMLVVPVLCCCSPWSSKGFCKLLAHSVCTSADPLSVLKLPQFIYSLDIGFTLLLFSYWFNELLVTWFIFTMIHQGTVLFQSGEQIVVVKVHDYDCVRHILHHIIMKSIQVSLLLREVLKDRFCIIQLKREQPNYCWKVLFSLETFKDNLARKKKNS